MKRKSKPWHEKVDGLCLNYLNVYREARSLASRMPELIDLKAHLRAGDPANEVFKRHPEVWDTRKLSLTPEFIQKIKQIPGMEGTRLTRDSVVLSREADILELAEAISSLESFPVEDRMGLYLFLALLIVPALDLLKSMKKQEFGEQPLDEAKVSAIAAQFCEMFAQALRGRLPEEVRKNSGGRW